jgi:hypothetical protein
VEGLKDTSVSMHRRHMVSLVRPFGRAFRRSRRASYFFHFAVWKTLGNPGLPHHKVWHLTCSYTYFSQEHLREVTVYEPVVIDPRSSVAGGRSTTLGLSLVWLCSVGYRGRGPYCRPHYVPNWPTLKSRAIRLRHYDHVAISP